MPSCFKIKKNRLSKLKIYPLLSQFRHNHLRQPFGVYNICLFDNGRHGDDVRNFARTVLPPDTNLKQIAVEQNPNEPDLKQVDGLLHAMRKINDLPPEQRPDYLLIPVLIGVPLLNLTDQMRAVCGGDIYLTPQNIKENKKYKDTKLIMTSIFHDKEAILKAGADLYLPKPYEIDELVRWVDIFIKENNNL